MNTWLHDPSVHSQIAQRVKDEALASWNLALEDDPRPSLPIQDLTAHICAWWSARESAGPERDQAKSRRPAPTQDTLRRSVLLSGLAQAARGARAGRARSALIALLRPKVRCLAGCYVRRAQVCRGMNLDDLEQEAFIKINAVLPRFDARRAFLWPWLNKVLRRHFLGLVRRPVRVWQQAGPTFSRHGPSAPQAATDHAAAPRGADPPTDQAQQSLALVELREAIDDVCWQLLREGHPRDAMTAFRLRHLREHRLHDIAWQLQRSITWVFKAIEATLRQVSARFAARYPSLAP